MLPALVTAAIAAAVTLYIWLILPRLRRGPAWSGLGARARATIAAYKAKLAAVCPSSISSASASAS